MSQKLTSRERVQEAVEHRTPAGRVPMTFDAEPEVLSHPQSLHPRILLASATGMWRCEIAADRTDLYWLRPAANAPAPSVVDFFTVASELLARYADVTISRVGRFAAIVNRVADHDAPGQFLVEHFCRSELASTALAGLESFEISSHKRYSMGDRFPVNSWIRFQTPDDQTPRPHSVIIVHQDLNTLPNDAQSEFTIAEIGDFFGLAALEHERSLPAFFPGVATP